MASGTSTSYVLTERPRGKIVPGRTFVKHTDPTPKAEELQDGQILFETLYISLDPGMKFMINATDQENPPIPTGIVMPSLALGRVVASRSSQFKPGDLVTANTGFRETAVVGESEVERAFKLSPGMEPADVLNAFGIPAMTAYFGVERIADIKVGDTVVISSAAGGTGMLVGQFARIKGAKRVVGIAGSDEKCQRLVKEYGFDAAVNYKSPDFRETLDAATPDLINVYWDNVGGEILDLALSRAAPHARFVVCGMISGYDTSLESVAPKNFFKVLMSRIRVEGFVWEEYRPEFNTAREQISEWISEGKLKTNTSIIKGGLDKIDEAWEELFAGGSMGKVVLEVKAA